MIDNKNHDHPENDNEFSALLINSDNEKTRKKSIIIHTNNYRFNAYFHFILMFVSMILLLFIGFILAILFLGYNLLDSPHLQGISSYQNNLNIHYNDTKNHKSSFEYDTIKQDCFDVNKPLDNNSIGILHCLYLNSPPLPWNSFYITTHNANITFSLQFKAQQINNHNKELSNPNKEEMNILIDQGIEYEHNNPSTTQPIYVWLFRYSSVYTGKFHLSIYFSDKKNDNTKQLFYSANSFYYTSDNYITKNSLLNYNEFNRVYDCSDAFDQIIDNQLARWAEFPSMFYQNLLNTKDSDCFAEYSTTHYAVDDNNKLYSEYSVPSQSWADSRISLFLLSLTRKLKFSGSLEMLVANIDSAKSVTDDYFPKFFPTSTKYRNDLLLPQWQLLELLLSGNLNLILLKNNLKYQTKFLEKLSKVYWRGAINSFNNERLNEENFQLHRRIRAALIANKINNELYDYYDIHVVYDHLKKFECPDKDYDCINSLLHQINKNYEPCLDHHKNSHNNYSYNPNQALNLCPLLFDSVPNSNQYQYRYLLSLDGFSSAWRLISLLLSGAVVIKQLSTFNEYWYELLQKDQHYMEIPADITTHTLNNVTKWLLNHPIQAQTIASNAQSHLNKLLAPQQIYCYTGKLLYNYSKQLNFPEYKPSNQLHSSWRYGLCYTNYLTNPHLWLYLIPIIKLFSVVLSVLSVAGLILYFTACSRSLFKCKFFLKTDEKTL
jgi:hypothetical protein